MKRLIREAVGYTIAAGSALMVDVSLLWVLVRFLYWDYLTAAATSFLAGAVVAYKLSVKFAFKCHKFQDRRLELISFVALGAVGLVVNAAVIFEAVNYFGLHFLVAKCIAAVFTFTCNFLLRRQILFVSPSSV